MKLNLDKCDQYEKNQKYQYATYNVYECVCCCWVPMKHFRSLESAKRYLLKYLERFDSSSRSFPNYKISKYDRPFGSCVKDYYFSVEM